MRFIRADAQMMKLHLRLPLKSVPDI